MSSNTSPGATTALHDATRPSIGVPSEIPVIQRIPAESGGYEVRAVALALEVTSHAGETWVYLGDGERQMVEVTVESMRRIGSVVLQALSGLESDVEARSDSGSTPR